MKGMWQSAQQRRLDIQELRRVELQSMKERLSSKRGTNSPQLALSKLSNRNAAYHMQTSRRSSQFENGPYRNILLGSQYHPQREGLSMLHTRDSNRNLSSMR